MVHKHITQEII
jgi:hypothetical protein